MSEQIDELDGVIDDALRDMTAGSPRQGLQGRVLARIDGASAPASAATHRLGGWSRMAALGDPLALLAILGLLTALVLPQLLQRQDRLPSSQQFATNSRSESRSPLEIAGGSKAAESGGMPAGPTTAIVRSPEGEPDRARLDVSAREESVAAGSGPVAAASDADAEAAAHSITLLGDPTPITDRPIDIAGLVITPIANDPIEIPLIEDNWPPKRPGRTN